MLTRSLLARVVLLAAVVLLTGVPASADPGMTCPDGQAIYARTQTCRIYVTGPGSAGGQQVADQSAAGGSGGEVSACVNRTSGRNEPVPCESERGWWSDEFQCYVSLADPQPAKGAPVWQGHTDGAIYFCFRTVGVNDPSNMFWSASMPAGPAAPVDPAVVAQTVVSQMELRAFDIGMVPEARVAGSIPSRSDWTPRSNSSCDAH